MRSLASEDLPALDNGVRAEGRYVDDYYVVAALAALEEDGTAVCHVRENFLYHTQGSRRKLREALVAQGAIRAVVELPGGCVASTPQKSALIVLAKGQAEDDVLLLDVTKVTSENRAYFTQSRLGLAPSEAGVEWIADMVLNRREVPGVSVLVPRDCIIETGSILRYATYAEPQMGDFPTRATAEILEEAEASTRYIDELDAEVDEILRRLED